MSSFKVVKFRCGRYGVVSGDSFISRAGLPWKDDLDVAAYCKMWKWQAKRLAKRLNIAYEVEVDGTE